MIYEIIVFKGYLRKAKRFLRQHPELRKVYGNALLLLATNPWHPSLRLHKLRGELDDLYAISITFAYRMTLTFKIQEGQIIPVDIGTHDQVY